MIVVSVRRDRITVSGHAGYAPAGQYIVCAAVSTLTQNLIKSIEDLTEDKIEYEISPGRVDIKYGNLSEKSKTLVDSFFIGICAVAESYPENVTIGRPGTEALGGADKAGECSGRSGKENKNYEKKNL